MSNNSRNDKVAHISDYWSLEQLIDVQDRISSERNAKSIRKIEELNRRLAEALEKEKDNN